MADGTFKPIEEIRRGERVACDVDPDKNNGPESCVVLGTSRRRVSQVVDLTVTSDGLWETITATPEHPFYVPSLGRYVPAGELASGRRLLTPEGHEAVLLSSHLRAAEVEVYNFEVAGAHNYYVSKARVLVHNVCPLGRGSTGRTLARNETERLAMEKVMQNPGGKSLSTEREFKMTDPRWPWSDGWEKFAHNVDGVEIHYVHNSKTMEYDDFKFKD